MKTRHIFVFGSNPEGRHGKGAALEAYQNWGAVYGQAEGLQGDSYAIITKELRKNKPAITIDDIANGVDRFLTFAAGHPEMTFIVSPIGCGLAGFDPEEIAPLFVNHPSNVELPDDFK